MKKILAVFLSVCVILSASCAVFADEVTSVEETAVTAPAPSEWARESVDRAAELNITESDISYSYAQPISREEFCELIYNYINVLGVDIEDASENFTDTDNKKIAALYTMGIISGKSETEFAPDDKLTREEAAVILNRMVNETVPVPVTEMYFAFDDEDKISKWAKNAVQVMCNMGAMNGVGENNFAPQDSYTTEQAITTIVRVYAVQSADTKIIGGADELAEITVVEEVEVSEFYIDEAVKHIKKAGELAATKEYVAMYVNDEEIKEGIEKLAELDFSKPLEAYYISFNPDKVAEYYEALYSEENIEFDFEKLVELNRFELGMFASMVNSKYGAKTIATTSILTSREGYIAPEDFEKDFGIFFKYDGDYSALVTFTKIGEGVIEGRMQFVRNSEKEDMLYFMSEVYDALGKDSLTIGKVK